MPPLRPIGGGPNFLAPTFSVAPTFLHFTASSAATPSQRQNPTATPSRSMPARGCPPSTTFQMTVDDDARRSANWDGTSLGMISPSSAKSPTWPTERISSPRQTRTAALSVRRHDADGRFRCDRNKWGKKIVGPTDESAGRCYENVKCKVTGTGWLRLREQVWSQSGS